MQGSAQDMVASWIGHKESGDTRKQREDVGCGRRVVERSLSRAGVVLPKLEYAPQSEFSSCDLSP